MNAAPVIDNADELTLDSAFARLWRGFMTARIAIGVVLLGLMVAPYVLAPQPSVDRWLISLCATYVIAAIAVRVATRPLPPGRRFDPQWVYTIGVDLVAFADLQFLQAGGFNYSPLFALPVLMAAVLGSSLLALGTAAGVTLLLLVDAWVLALTAPAELTSRFLQAGLTGTGYFALAFLVNQLSARLAREEEAARHGRRAARTQAQVNELVIEALSVGVLVVDAQGKVHAVNPAAREVLGSPDMRHGTSFSLDAQPGWAPLQAIALQTFSAHEAQNADIALTEEGAGARRVRVRTRLTGAGMGLGNAYAHADAAQGDGLCVMFLHDLREMEARLRTEKLAAMGRMSAAVAHEIRNPLAAISQANELMDEDLHEPALRQLSSLVRKNAQRLAQIVDDILDISRARVGPGAATQMLELDATVAAACADWTAQTRSASRVHIVLAAPSARVSFEAGHLRRVLVNLLDNALRYAGEQPDSIRVWTRVVAGRASLHVWSDGAPLEVTVQRHLFEPFFSSESRSSGLGLYICRELCERHGAAMKYERRSAGSERSVREGNEFSVHFDAPSRPLAASPSFDKIAA